MSRRWRQNEPFEAPATDPRRICVLIFTYDRGPQLRRLLSDIIATRGAHDVDVYVFDDGTPRPSRECQELVRREGWVWRTCEHHGKKRFWELVTDAYGFLRTLEYDTFISLPDDARLAAGFFDHAVRMWESLEPRAVCLSVWRDPRDYCWTGQTPRDAGEVRETGWVDGAFIADRDYFDVRIRPITSGFWDVNPKRGSGVGQRITTWWAEQGRTMYQVQESLMAHAGCRVSRMNPEERLEHPLRAVRFRDGQRVCDAYELEEPVMATLASVPRRVELLERTVESLLPQVDELGVFLNDYTEVPRFLEHPRVTVARSQNHEDRGDAGKFFWAPERGYHLTCDDDLIYPPDYVREMIAAIEHYKREALVSFHGSQVRTDFATRQIFHCKRGLPKDVRVHLPGTGVFGYHVDAPIRFPFESFETANMADVWVGLAAKRAGVPVIARRHGGGWIQTQRDPEDRSVYRHFAHRAMKQNQLISRAAPWPQYDRPIL